MNNTTTIERWEKDKVATMVRRGKIREVRFPSLDHCVSTDVATGQIPICTCNFLSIAFQDLTFFAFRISAEDGTSNPFLVKSRGYGVGRPLLPAMG
jgi:hypothetical protein